MKKTVLMAAVFGCAFAAVAAGESGWRLTVGPAMGGALRSSLRVAPGRMPAVGGGAAGGITKAEAQAEGDKIGNGRVDLGGGYFIDPNDAAGVAGETVNWRLPAGSLDAGAAAMTVRHEYTEVTGADAGGAVRDKDRELDYGASVMVEREMFRGERFGVDFGLAASWFMRNDAFKARGQVGGQTVETGAYETTISMDADEVSDPWFANADGSFGGGTFAGPGPVMSFGGIAHSWADVTRTEVGGAFVSARGDYQEAELALLVRPWFEVTDWLRVVGTVGAGVSYARFDLTTSASGAGGFAYRHREAFDSWDVYGVAGLGMMARWAEFCAGFDFLAKIGDGAVKVDGADAHGKIEREPVTLRVYVGYEF